MQIVDFIARHTGKTVHELFFSLPALVSLSQAADGKMTIDHWDDSLETTRPSDAEIAAWLAEPEDGKALKLLAISEKVLAILALGVPVAGGLHIALDDGTRADMGSMATTALAVLSGAVAWPEGYAKGWITIENTRIPMPAPADGLALAAVVGAYYSSVVQNGRDLKDAVIASANDGDLAAIDINFGWPA